MIVLVTGANGQVGQNLLKLQSSTVHTLIGLTKGELDITQEKNVLQAFAKYQPDIVINAAGYTAVDKAESEINKAYAVNEKGPSNLALACAQFHIPLLHISTDYVFDGCKNSAYIETDPVNPLGVYGRSKEVGEQAIRSALEQHIILRTSWVFSAEGDNFVKTILSLGAKQDSVNVVDDQFGGPTSAAAIANVLLAIAKHYFSGAQVNWGTYHFCELPYVSWYEFANEIFEQASNIGIIKYKVRVNPVPSSSYLTAVNRPKNSRLLTKKLVDSVRLDQLDWRNSLNTVLIQLKKTN